MIYLIDSNVVSELMRPAPSDKVVTWLDRHAGNCALPTIANFEVRAGINTMPPGRRRDELMGAFERIVARLGPRVVSFDLSSAEMAAELAGVSASAGRGMTTGDVQITGIAGAYGLTLVTRNVKNFAATGIDLVNTRRAFCSDLTLWGQWCRSRRVQPAVAESADVAAWIRALAGIETSDC